MKRIYPVKTTEQLYEASAALFAALLSLSKNDPAFTGRLMARINALTDCTFAVAETSVREDVRSAARKAKKRGRK